MLAAEFAVLVHFKSVGVILLVFLCVVVSLLALSARQRDFNSHFFGTSRLDYARVVPTHVRNCDNVAVTWQRAASSRTSLPKTHFFHTILAAIFAQKKNPLAEVEIFYHTFCPLSIVFLKKVFGRIIYY